MMHKLDRREFLGASVVSLAALAVGAQAAGEDEPSKSSAEKPAKKTSAPQPIVKAGVQDATRPDTLFLTWQRDPTTTMTVQWLGPPALAENPAVQYATGAAGKGWHSVATRARPYPRTPLHVFRAELTGLKPGTEYYFRIGQESATYPFRTMPAKATDSFQSVSGGDCNINAHAIANNILAARQDPMFALIGGDLGYDDGQKVDQSLGLLP